MSNSISKYATKIESLDDLQRLAKLLEASGYFDAKGDSHTAIAQIATKILAGQEMGYGPFTSVQGIHVIKGKPTLSANLMATAVKGHPRYDYRVRKMEDAVVTIEFFEDGESIGTSSFTAAEARKAQTQNMDKFPRNMLFARAMSNGVKWYCPDVFNGNTVYTPDELGADVNGDGDYVVSSTPERADRFYRTTEPEQLDVEPDGNCHRQIEEDNGPTVIETILAPADTPHEERSTHLYDPENDTIAPLLYTADDTTVVIAESALTSPPAAQQWAVDTHYCGNAYHAKNRWLNIVKQDFDGKVEPSQVKSIIYAFVADCLAKGIEQTPVGV